MLSISKRNLNYYEIFQLHSVEWLVGYLQRGLLRVKVTLDGCDSSRVFMVFFHLFMDGPCSAFFAVDVHGETEVVCVSGQCRDSLL